MKIIFPVDVARILRKIEFLHLRQRDPIIVVAAAVRIQLEHDARQTSGVFIDNEEIWVVDENIVDERLISTAGALVVVVV